MHLPLLQYLVSAPSRFASQELMYSAPLLQHTGSTVVGQGLGAIIPPSSNPRKAASVVTMPKAKKKNEAAEIFMFELI